VVVVSPSLNGQQQKKERRVQITKYCSKKRCCCCQGETRQQLHLLAGFSLFFILSSNKLGKALLLVIMQFCWAAAIF
jgi:hypothetical protein